MVTCVKACREVGGPEETHARNRTAEDKRTARRAEQVWSSYRPGSKCHPVLATEQTYSYISWSCTCWRT